MSCKYEFIDGEKDNFAVVKMCAWAGVSTSGFYEWRSRPASATATRRAQLTEHVKKIFTDSDETYGYRRVWHQLQREGVSCGPELVRFIMRAEDLVPCQPKPWRCITTMADQAAEATADLLGRDFTADAPGQKLIGDITYIPTWQGFVYLATVIDCHTRMVAGYAIADHMTAKLVCDALTMAARRIEILDGAIFHSDRGAQGEFNWSSQHLDREVVRWVTRNGRWMFGCIGVRFRRRGGRRWPGARIGFGSGRQSLVARRRRTHVSWRACRGRLGSAGSVTLAG